MSIDDEVTSVEAKLPTFTVEMPEGYARGTHLRMEIEFRVRSIRYEEDRKGNLTHQMILAVEEVELKKVLTQDEADVTSLGSFEHSSEIDGQTTIDDSVFEPVPDFESEPVDPAYVPF